MSASVSNCFVRRQLGGLSTIVLGSAASESLKVHRDVITKFPTANVVEHIILEFFSEAGPMTLDYLDGSLSIMDAGTPQVETATITAAAGATSNGTLTLTLTGLGITGSPLAVPVALTTAAHNTAAKITAACVAQLRTIPSLTAIYDVTADGANIVLTSTRPRANDGTLNLAIPAALGVSAAASSTNTTAGVAGVWASSTAARWGLSGGSPVEFLHVEVLPPLNGALLFEGGFGGIEVVPGSGFYLSTLAANVDVSSTSAPASQFAPKTAEILIIARDPDKV